MNFRFSCVCDGRGEENGKSRLQVENQTSGRLKMVNKLGCWHVSAGLGKQNNTWEERNSE